MNLRQRKYLMEMSADELYADGHWITFRGKPLFIGGVQRKHRPKRPNKSAGKIVTLKKKDGSTFTKRIYRKSWVKKQEKFKFAVMASMAKNIERMDRMLKYECERKKLDQKKATATALLIMIKTGMRVGGGHGGTGKTRGEETHGTTTLERQHVKITGDTVEFKYLGKAGIKHSHIVHDGSIANSLREFMGGQDEAPDDKTPLFTYKVGRTKDVLDRRDVDKRLKKFDRDYRPKDLRTLKANEVASDEVFKILGEPLSSPTTKRETKKVIKSVINRIAERVSGELANTPSVAKGSYINPHLIEVVLAEMRLS